MIKMYSLVIFPDIDIIKQPSECNYDFYLYLLEIWKHLNVWHLNNSKITVWGLGCIVLQKY